MARHRIYEQKAVCMLMKLLHLGSKNVYLGPTLPALFLNNVFDTLVKTFKLYPATAQADDLKAILSAPNPVHESQIQSKIPAVYTFRSGDFFGHAQNPSRLETDGSSGV